MSSTICHLESIVPINSSEMYLEIREEPFPKCSVRYENEHRNVLIYGCSEDRKKKTFPRVKVHGCSKYTDTSYLVVEASCVTKDEPYEPHIYRLSGKKCGDDEYCVDGKYYVRVNNLTMEAVFRNMNVFRITQKNSNAPYQHRKTTGSKTDSVDNDAFRLQFRLYSEHWGFLGKPIQSRPITNVRTRTFE